MLLTVALATSLAPLNSTMIAVALPDILKQFNVSLDSGAWLITGYLITMAAIQPVAGKLGDRLGRRSLLIGGVAYFGFASIGAALAPNLGLLLAFRIQQAIAGAIAIPNGSALVRELVPGNRRASSYGMLGAVASLAAAGGPPLGGVLTSLFGWQAIFWANAPIVVMSLILGWACLPRVTRPAVKGSFDVPGAVLLLISLVGVSLVLHTEPVDGGSLVWVGGIALVIASFVAFVAQERRHAEPILRPEFFRVRTFSAACVSIALSNLAMYSILLALPELLIKEPGWNTAKVGLVLVALSATTVIFAPLGGRLADRLGRRTPVVLGLSVFALAVAPLAFLHIMPATPVLLAILMCAGSGLGLSSAGIQTAAVEALDPRDAGAASGIFSTSRYFGSITGASILPALIAGSSGGATMAVFVMVAVSAALAVVAALLLSPVTQPLARAA
jgi:EmrB/QacA subfamily drug resistance transporter